MKYFLVLLLLCNTLLSFSQETTLDELFNNSNYCEVIRVADEQLSKNSNDYSAWYYKGLAENALYKFKESSVSFANAYKLSPNNQQILFLLATALESEGNILESINTYKKIVSSDSTNIQANSRLASLYKNQKEYINAVNIYKKLIKQDSTNGYFYSQLAYCCDKMGFFLPVISYYEKAVSLNPNDYQSQHALISELVSQKYYDIATYYIDSFLIQYPIDFYLLKQKAYVSALSGRYLDAVKEFKHVISVGDSSLFSYKYYGQSLYNNGQFDESVIWLDKYLKKRPDDFQNQLIMGLACQHDYQYEKSLTHLDIAMYLKYDKKMIARIFSEKATTQIKYGDYLGYRDSIPEHSEKYYTDARDNYLKSLEIYADGYNILKDLGLLYETKMKDMKIALYYYEKYYDALNPNDINEHELDWIQQKISGLKETVFFIGN
ncbi:MAG: hypothetical protein JEZ09_20370 [Salinivirgaceae bacterium]|nr:hypothetical protein [Salinivirgaceae bacterium]